MLLLLLLLLHSQSRFKESKGHRVTFWIPMCTCFFICVSVFSVVFVLFPFVFRVLGLLEIVGITNIFKLGCIMGFNKVGARAHRLAQVRCVIHDVMCAVCMISFVMFVCWV